MAFDDEAFKKFNGEVLGAEKADKEYIKYQKIAEGAKKATTSLEDYYAQCVQLNEYASSENYRMFVNEKVEQNLSTKDGQTHFLEKNKDLYDKIIEQQKEELRLKQEKADIERKIAELQSKTTIGTAENQSQGKSKRQKKKNIKKTSEAVSITNTELIEQQEALDNVNKLLGQNEEKTKTFVKQQGDLHASVRNINKDFAEFMVNNPGATVEDYNKALKKQKITAKAAHAKQVLLNTAVSSLTGIVISVALSALQAWINRVKDMTAAGAEAAEALNEQSTSIADYKQNIENLRKSLDSGNLSEAEAYDVRSQLLDIQHELIDTYGDEAKGIDLINGGLETQLGLLTGINKEKASQFLNENTKEIEESRKYLEKAHNKGGFLLSEFERNIFANDYSIGSNEIRKLKSNNKEAYDELMSIVSDVGLSSSEDLLNTYIKAENMTQADTYEAYSKLAEEIRNSATLRNVDLDSFLKQLSEETGDLNDEELTNAQATMKAYAESTIRTTPELFKIYTDLTVAQEKYNEALLSGDTSTIEEAEKEIQRVNDTIKNTAAITNDTYIKDYFDDMFDTGSLSVNAMKFQETVEKIEENKYLLKPNSADDALNSENQDLIDAIRKLKGLEDQEVKALADGVGSEERLEGYKSLEKAAEQEGITIEEAINALVNTGVLNSRAADAVKYATNSFSALTENYSEVSNNLDKFSNAATKISSGDILSKDEVNELIALDSTLIDDVEQVSGGYKIAYEKLEAARTRMLQSQRDTIISEIKDNNQNTEDIKAEMQEVADQIRTESLKGKDRDNNYIENRRKHLKELSQDLKDQQTETKQLWFIWKQLQNPAIKYTETISNLASQFDTISEAITNVKNDMDKFGKVSAKTALDFMQSVPDWENYLSVDENGGISFDFFDTNNEKITELIKTTTGYNEIEQRLIKTVDSANNAFTSQSNVVNNLKTKLDAAIQNNDSPEVINQLSNQLSAAEIRLDSLGNVSEESKEQLDGLKSVLADLIELFKSSQAVTDFNNAIENIEYDYSMNNIDTEEYKKQLKAERDALENATDGINDPEAEKLIRDYDIKINDLEKSQLEKQYSDEKQMLEEQLADRIITFDEYHRQLASINEKYYGANSTLGKTEDGSDQYSANLREIALAGKDGFDRAIQELDNARELGQIKSAEEYWKQYTALAEKYLSNVPALASDYAEAQKTLQTTALTEQFEEEQKLLERNYNDNKITLSEYLDEYTSLWEKYYKDKAQFSEEDYETQKAIFDETKEGIQNQIDALESISESRTAPLQSEIDALNEIKDEYNEVHEAKIAALEEEKSAIEEANEAQERTNDLLEKEQALREASVKRRIVYVGGSQWESRRDEKAYEEAKKERDEALKESEIHYIEKQIEALEQEKEARDSAIDREISAREEAIKKLETPINNLITVLSALVAEQHNLDPKFIEEILNTSSGQDALNELNEQISINNQLAAQNKTKLKNNNSINQSEILSMVNELAASHNKTPAEIASSLGLNLPAFDSSELNKNSVVIDDNTSALDNNTKATTELTSLMSDTTDAPDAASDIITAGGFNLVADSEGNLTKIPVMINGKAVEGRKIDAVTAAEWEENRKNEKNNNLIKAISDIDLSSISNKTTANLLKQLSNSNIISKGITETSNISPNVIMSNDKLPTVLTGAPAFNCVFNINGSMDRKTMDEVEHRLDSKFIEYTQKLTNAVTTSYNKQMSKI